MLWRSANSKHPSSLTRRLSFFYTLSSIGLLTVIVLLFFPSLARILAHYNTHDYATLTVECIKELLILLLFVSISGMILGHFIARKGLSAIQDLERTISRLSADGLLDERLDIHHWPVELKPLGQQFNHMLERLNHSFNQLTQFSSDLAHELRHPLQHLQQRTELALSQEHIAPAEQDRLVAYMEEFQMLSKLVEQLLFIARTEQAQTPLNKKLIPLVPLIDKIIDYFIALANDKQILLDYSGEGILWADPILIQRLLSNLIANAIEYTEMGGNIHISIAQNTFTITDTGKGIAPDHLAKIFQRFYQIDNARSNRDTLGLGLPIVKSIVDLHQGEIQIQSVVNQGTKVTVVFPKPSV